MSALTDKEIEQIINDNTTEFNDITINRNTLKDLLKNNYNGNDYANLTEVLKDYFDGWIVVNTNPPKSVIVGKSVVVEGIIKLLIQQKKE
jgi:hypothetical protein